MVKWVLYNMGYIIWVNFIHKMFTEYLKLSHQENQSINETHLQNHLSLGLRTIKTWSMIFQLSSSIYTKKKGISK